MRTWDLVCKLTKPFYGTGIGRLPGVENLYLSVYRKWGMSKNPVLKFQDLEFELDPTSALTPPILTHGNWEPDETELFIKEVHEGMTVVDVGAGFGYYSCIASKLVGRRGRVYAIEPFPKAYNLLCRNIAKNSLTNIVPLRVAAWDSEGTIEFHATKTQSGISPIPHKSDVVLPVARLDTFITEEKVDLIKIDTDGHDSRVLGGMKRIIKDSLDLKLFIEVYPKGLVLAGSSDKALVSFLEEHFTLAIIDEKIHGLRQLGNQAYKEVSKATRLKGAVDLFCTRRLSE
jgi:FkbM family methyltransferase